MMLSRFMNTKISQLREPKQPQEIEEEEVIDQKENNEEEYDDDEQEGVEDDDDEEQQKQKQRQEQQQQQKQKKEQQQHDDENELVDAKSIESEKNLSIVESSHVGVDITRSKSINTVDDNDNDVIVDITRSNPKTDGKNDNDDDVLLSGDEIDDGMESSSSSSSSLDLPQTTITITVNNDAATASTSSRFSPFSLLSTTRKPVTATTTTTYNNDGDVLISGDESNDVSTTKTVTTAKPFRRKNKKSSSSASAFKSLQRTLRRYDDPVRTLFELCHKRRPIRISSNNIISRKRGLSEDSIDINSVDECDDDDEEIDEEEKNIFENDIYWDFHHLLQSHIHVIHNMQYYDIYNINGYNALHCICTNPDLANHQLLIQLFIDTSISYQEEIEENEMNNNNRNTLFMNRKRIQNQRRRQQFNEQRRLQFISQKKNKKKILEEEESDSIIMNQEMNNSTSGGNTISDDELLHQQPTSAQILYQKSIKTGEVPLHIACTTGYCSIETIQFILSYYPASICIPERIYGNFPLHSICTTLLCYLDDNNTIMNNIDIINNSFHIIKILIQQWPESCQIPNRDGNIPLHLIVQTIINMIITNILHSNNTNEQQYQSEEDIVNSNKGNKTNMCNDNDNMNTEPEIIALLYNNSTNIMETPLNETNLLLLVEQQSQDNNSNPKYQKEDEGEIEAEVEGDNNEEIQTDDNDDDDISIILYYEVAIHIIDYLIDIYPDGKTIHNRNELTPYRIVLSIIGNSLNEMKQSSSLIKNTHYPILYTIISKLQTTTTLVVPTNNIIDSDDVIIEQQQYHNHHHDKDIANAIHDDDRDTPPPTGSILDNHQNDLVIVDHPNQLNNDNHCNVTLCSTMNLPLDCTDDMKSSSESLPIKSTTSIPYNQDGKSEDVMMDENKIIAMHDYITPSSYATIKEVIGDNTSTNNNALQGIPLNLMNHHHHHRMTHHHQIFRRYVKNEESMKQKCKSSNNAKNNGTFDNDDDENSTSSSTTTGSSNPCVVELLDLEIGISDIVISKINSHLYELLASDNDDDDIDDEEKLDEEVELDDEEELDNEEEYEDADYMNDNGTDEENVDDE